MRKISLSGNTIKDLATLNRAQTMFLNLYIKGYTHVTLHSYRFCIELTVYAPTLKDLKDAETIIRNSWGDGDELEYKVFDESEKLFASLTWNSDFIENETD